MTKAKIERHGMFDYRWSVNNVRGFAWTRSGAIRAANKSSKRIRRWVLAKQTAEIIELDGEK